MRTADMDVGMAGSSQRNSDVSTRMLAADQRLLTTRNVGLQQAAKFVDLE